MMALSTAAIFCIGFLSLLTTGWAQSIVTPPTHSVGWVGDRLNLTCQLQGDLGQLTFEWTEYISDPLGQRIFSVPEYSPIDSSKYEIFGTYDLSLKSPTWMDSGYYGCRLSSQAQPSPAHVFIFERHMLTAPTMSEGETHTLECEARFGADSKLMETVENRPKMSMEVDATPLNGIVQTMTLSANGQPHILRGYANYTAVARDNGRPFFCIVTTSVPQYEAMDSEPLDITYPVQNIQFASPAGSGPNQQLMVGDHVNCTADGNPTPDYFWRANYTPAETKESQGMTLYITNEMIDANNRENEWTCTATNNIAFGPARTMNTISEMLRFTVAPQLVVGIVNPTPSNTTAVVGEEVTLLCGYSGPDTFEWMEYITSQLGTGIFITPPDSQPPNAIKYRVDGSYNLVVLDLDVTDGGLYGCRSYDMGSHARAQLLVVEEPSLLIPESLVEMRSTQITCSVNYGGSTDSSTTQIPTMEIAMDGSPQTATIEHTPPVPGDPDTYVAGYLSATVNYTANRNDNGRNLTCEVKTEVPAFSVMSWETMEIRYPVENILLDPVKLDYYIGELINCSADGVPEPEYQWSPIESPAPRTVDGASLEILSNMVGFNQWECQASNTVESTEVMTVTIDFNVLNEDVSNESQALRAFSVVWLCVTSLLATVVCESRA